MFNFKRIQKIIYIIIILSILFIPLIIHFLYKNDFNISFFYSTWESGDILQYCGTILSAIIAIFGIYYTLHENQKENLKKLNLENKPHMVSETIRLMNIKDKENFEDNQNNIMILNKSSFVFYCLKSKLDKLSFKKYYYEIKENNYVVILYELENIGLGHATNLKLDFSLDNTHVYPFVQTYLKKEDKRVFYLYINKELIDAKGLTLSIEVEYNDITKLNRYSQLEKIYLHYIEKQNTYCFDRAESSPLSEQKNIKTDDRG